MYDKLALKMLFRNSPIVFDEEVGIYQYNITDNYGFGLTLYFISCEGFISVQLNYKNHMVYEISTEYEATIEVEQDNFNIFNKNENEPVAQIMVIPNVLPFSSLFNLNTQSKQIAKQPNQQKSLLKYNDFDLTALFCNYPKVLNEEAQIFEYSINDERGFILTLKLAVHDRSAVILLEFEDQQVYKVEIDQISEIKTEKDKFQIFKENLEEAVVQVMVIPNFTQDSSLFTLDAKL